MSAVRGVGRPRSNGTGEDTESEAMIYEGCSLSQLGRIFDMDVRAIKPKIYGLKPVKLRGGHPIFKLKDAAPYLLKPRLSAEEFMAKMKTVDLPPELQKDVWAAKRAQQQYEKEAGDLWPTAKVIEKVSELFKVLKLQILLTRDGVERLTELTPKQRRIIQSAMDGALRDLHAKVIENFTVEGQPAPAVSDEDEDDEL